MRDKRKGKLDRHYYILVDGRKCRILNYKVKEIESYLLEGRRLTLVTKFGGEGFFVDHDTGGEILIENEKERIIFHVRMMSHSSGMRVSYAGVWSYTYWIIDQRVEPKMVRQASENLAIGDTAATAIEME